MRRPSATPPWAAMPGWAGGRTFKLENGVFYFISTVGDKPIW